MNAPQVVMIVLVVLALVFDLQDHGTQRNVNFIHSFVGKVILVGLLYWGGFWK